MCKSKFLLLALALMAFSVASVPLATTAAHAGLNDDGNGIQPVLSWWGMPRCTAEQNRKILCSDAKDFGYVCTNYWASIGVNATWHWVRIDPSELATRCPQ